MPNIMIYLIRILLFPVASLICCLPIQADQTLPNIVLILADDMGYDSVSVNNSKGMGPLATPNIDRLASQGMNFTDAHSSSAVCTPTRYGLLTGRYCWRTALKKEVLWSYGRPLIQADRLTVMELLKHQGYTTGMVGKWHLGFDWYDADGEIANADIRIHDALFKKGRDRILACANRIDYTKPLTGGPIDHGFDFYFGVDVPNFPPYTWIENSKVTEIPTEPKPKSMFGQEGLMVSGWDLEQILPGLAERSEQFIAAQSQTKEPFFLYLSLTSPHTPIAPSPPFQGKSVNKYADFIVETDAVVGRVMQAIDQAGIADNTLVLFTADNGTAAACRFDAMKQKGVDFKVHHRGNKGMIYDGGHRVPFVARWPGNIESGSTCREVICLNDFMATMAELTSAKLPTTAAEDSTSILPLMTGEQARLEQRPAVVHHSYGGQFAIRKAEWKLVIADPPELYNMHADPKETTNVAGDNPAVVEQLKALLATYQSSGRSRD